MASSNHIRNPLEWGGEKLRGAGDALGRTGHALHLGEELPAAALPAVRRIGIDDLRLALLRGLDDFRSYRTDVIFICLIYPLAGLLLARLAFGYEMLPLLFPLMSGFALIGPVAAIGLYEMSRRREAGAEVGWADAFGVVASPAFGPILVLGIFLALIFLVWLSVAYGIYLAIFGAATPVSATAFLSAVLTTPSGWMLILIGCGIGFLFAVLVLSISVVSFPMLLDRDVGLVAAVATSMRAVAANPGPMAVWGAIVAGGLVLGTLPALLGLIFVMPILGHATWHLYRRMVT